MTAAFVAAKTVAWVDRHAARDLFDLYQLARSGAVDGEAAALYRRYGPTAHAPGDHDFTRAPDAATWHRELSGQTRLTVSATDALVAVADAWASVASR